MEKWEYKTIKSDSKTEKNPDTSNFTMVLNQQGSVGWELVSCFTLAGTGEIMAVFKRKINTGSAASEDKPFNARERGGSGFSGKKFHPRGEESSSFGDKPRTYGDKPRTYGDKPRTYGKSAGYKGKSSGYKEKDSSYAGKDSGFSGKSSGRSGKGPGSGKSFGYSKKSFK